ncbi:hypothetical protein [Bordetella parapertussis]|uniref:hypothetical protein n=1 Tax=Bordetella parapertussis TaxID=519 RepID=UPI001F2DB88D
MLVPVHEHRTGRPLRGARRAMAVTLAVLAPAGAAAAAGGIARKAQRRLPRPAMAYR